MAGEGQLLLHEGGGQVVEELLKPGDEANQVVNLLQELAVSLRQLGLQDTEWRIDRRTADHGR